jgi:lysophospholipase L1-like esterase
MTGLSLLTPHLLSSASPANPLTVPPFTVPSISLTSGNTCPSSQFPISSWELCRAAASLYSQGDKAGDIDGADYNGVENDEDWPKGCYYCDDVDGCADGLWFNEANVGSAHSDASVLCSPDLSPATHGGTLFVGDSDIDHWSSVETSLAGRGAAVYNVGYGGYECSDVVAEADAFIEAFQPQAVVLVCGENDLGGGRSVAVTFERYKNAVQKYIDSEATVFSIGTKPEPDTTALHGQYRELDARIMEYSRTLNGELQFIDAHAGFAYRGNPTSGSTNFYQDDGLHLSSVGYAVWENWLETAMYTEARGDCQVWREDSDAGLVCVATKNAGDVEEEEEGVTEGEDETIQGDDEQFDTEFNGKGFKLGANAGVVVIAAAAASALFSST